MQAHLQRAIETARAGHKDQARDLLVFILNEEPRNLTAWKWFATVAASEDEARQAIQNILLLSPGDAWAIQALGKLESGRASVQPLAPRQDRRRRGVAAGLAVGLAIVVVGLCAVSLLLVVADGGLGTSTFPFLAEGPASTSAATGVAIGEFIPPTLPPSWTPSVTPTSLPTVTPLPTQTATPLPAATVTPVPTPEAIDAPPISDIDQVSLDELVDVSGSIISTESYQYYAVTGSNADQINQSILDNGPKGGGVDAIAQIQYSISLHYTVLQTPASCSPEDAVAYLQMEFTYPEFAPVPNTPQSLLDQWNNFLQRVIDHEETHADIATDCAQSMVNSFLSLPPAATCSQLDNAIGAMQVSEDAKCDEQQIAFDIAEGGDSFP